MKKIKIYKVKEILEELEDAIKNRKPFSIIRLGDGGIKFLHSILTNNKTRLVSIIKKEGIPPKMIYPFFYLFGKYLSQANFIDTPQMYFNKEFWPRFKRPDIIPIIKDWRNIYYDSEINNGNRYCNPEFNFLSLLKGINKRNLTDIIRNKMVYCITNCRGIKPILQRVCNVKIIEIVGWNGNLYENNYKDVTKFIKKNANEPDLWFMGAGEIGRIWSGMIKQRGGRVVDVGSLFDVWCGKKLPKRLENFIFKTFKTGLEFRLTEKGKKYKEYI